MTTFAPESAPCGACGHVFTRHVLSSTNAFGSPDLDTRPPEMQRSTMPAWVHRCPACGYCAGDPTKFDATCRPTLDSAQYRAQLADPHYPELASNFICAGMLAETRDQLNDAAWDYLHAAWALDDTEKPFLASRWRNKAANLFLTLLNTNGRFAEDPGASEAILTDCLRRAGRGPEALAIIERGLRANPNDVIQKVLCFQKSLIAGGDTSRHLIQEAMQTQ